MNVYETDKELAGLLGVIEFCIDNRGVSAVLDAVAEACRNKAVVMRDVHGDQKLARSWGKLAETIQDISDN